jgi:RNA polymerase sigma factor (sigma-70 family)
MAVNSFNRVLRRLGAAALARDGGGLTDGELLGHFVVHRDGAAFEALVRRHGPMVQGVCRRLLNCRHDAEDAFQATFLVLVRKAASVVPRELVGNWLYGVAYRTALEARATRQRRRSKETQAREGVMADARDVVEESANRELRQALDRELARLPDRYRAAIVLCDLEGRTRKEAAKLLGWPEGTVATRQTRARRLLARRLAGRGLTLTGGVLTVLASQARAGVSGPAVASVVQAATAVAAGQAVTAAFPPRVVALTEGVLKTMLLQRLKVVLGILVAVALMASAVGTWTRPALAQAQEPAVARSTQDRAGEKTSAEGQAALLLQLQAIPWHLFSSDPDKGTITVTDRPLATGGALDIRLTFPPGCLTLERLEVAGDAKITLNGKVARLKDLQDGMQLALQFTEKGTRITKICAFGPRRGYVLKGVNPDDRTIAVALSDDATPVVLAVKKGAYIYANGNERELDYLKEGMRLDLQMMLQKGRLVVHDIRASR